MSEAELKQWLREWVSNATKLPLDQVTEDRPMEEFGLSSRDAVALSGDIEDKTDVKLTATVAFMHPTIATLAEYIINGPPEGVALDDDASAYQRGGLSDWLDVAVVGVAARFPGGANSPREMWDILLEGRDATSERPEGRWDEFTAEPRIADMLSKIPTRGGYLDDVQSFDCEFFSISPTEAVMIDPQQRLAMELTWEGLENARIPASELKGKDVGVFLGSSTNDYTFVVLADPTKTHPYAITGTATSVIAGRVSYYFDFHGPAISLDTACSSALVAVHQAVRSLRAGESSVAIAGGVNMLLTPLVHVGFGSLPGALAPDGKIKPFSSDSNGFNRSEGGGVLILKRLADAKRDGDQILAVISGSAVNSDGRSNGLIAPNPIAQAEVIRAAYRDAGVHPKDVDYVEAHGTGTPIGDPIEAEGLNAAVSSRHTDEQPLLMGSAKSNFGHLESAAGAVGLIKTVLALKNNQIPPQINYAGPSPYIPFDFYHQKVVTEPTEWPRYSGHAVAGVSGFGFSGTNAHVVLREVLPKDLGIEQPQSEGDDQQQAGDQTDEIQGAPSRGVREGGEERAPVHEARSNAGDRRLSPALKQVPLVLSAFVPSRRRKAAQDLVNWLESQDPKDVDLEAVGRSLAKRNHARARAVVLASTVEEAIQGLRAIADGKASLPPSQDGSGPLVFSADQPAALGPAWVVSGFGAQHRKMAKQLYEENPVFAKAIDEVNELIEFEYGESVVEMITDDSVDYSVGTAQIGIFAVQIGLAALLRHHGAQPAAIIGHSMAEATCAYLTGGLPLDQAVRVICARARLMGEGERMLGGDNYAGVQIIWPMALVEYSAEDVKELVKDFPEVEICVYAAPTHTVIGGPQAQVEAVVAKAEAAGKLARLLPTRGSSHCSQMDPLLGELSAELSDLEPQPLKVGFYSSVIADSYFPPGAGPIHGTDYWITNLRHAVWFAQAVRKAVDAGHTVFLELSPNPVSLVPVAATTFAAGVHDATLLHTLKRKEDESASVVAAMVQLWVHGGSLDVSSLFGPGDYADIPLTAWQRKRLWVDAKISSSAGSGILPGAHVLLPDGRHVWEVRADVVKDVQELVSLSAKAVFPEATVTALNQLAPIPSEEPDVLLTTTLTPHLGGASVRVQRQGSFDVLVEAVVSASADAAPAGEIKVLEPVGQDAKEKFDLGGTVGQAAELYDAIPAVGGLGFEDRWDPNGSETLSHRLRSIIAGAMGFDAEDLPLEVPLIELGLDSLSAIRIKHRVEYDFDIPPVQLQAVRNANAVDVETYVQYAVDNREVVAEIYEQQQKGNLDPEDIDLSTDPIGQIKAQLTAEGQEDFVVTRATVRQYIAQLKTQKGEPVPEGLLDDEPAAAQDHVSAAPAEEASAEAAAPEPADTAQPADAAQPTPDVDLSDQRAVAEAAGADVPPRDAAERLTFAAWIAVVGASPGGVFNTLPVPDEETAEKLAARLSDRAKGEITVDDIFDCENIEQLANIVRVPLEGGNVGPVRLLRARTDETGGVPVFLFHPAGGSSIVYEPLAKRLPATTPIFGMERHEAKTIEERAWHYVPLLKEIQGDGPYVLGGWSFGGYLAYAVALALKQEGADVPLLALIDSVRPSETPKDTPEEQRARIDRYFAFAKRNYGVATDIEPPYEKLIGASEEDQIKLVLDMMKLAGVQIPGGMIEHQRASYLDNLAIIKGELRAYDSPVVLYRADRMHDGGVELEPAYANIDPDGGWAPYVQNLDIVQCGGDHISIIDEPRISVVGADLSHRLAAIEADVLAKK
nr:polyketide synthase Pks13 [Segniliparus rotundus]